MKYYNPILHGTQHAWADNTRHFIGGGIGEAALIGAAMGGGKALVTGDNVLEGAMLGGITGGAMGGLSSALSPALQGAKTAAEAGATTAGLTAAEQAAMNMAPTYTTEIGGANLLSSGASQEAQRQALLQQGAMGNTNALASTPGMGGVSVGNVGNVGNVGSVGSVGNAAPVEWYNRPGVDLRDYTDKDSMLGKGLAWWNEQGPAGRAMYSGLGGAAMGYMEPPEPYVPPEKEKSKLVGFNADEFTPYTPTPPQPYYQARYAQGGIAALANGGMTRDVNFSGSSVSSEAPIGLAGGGSLSNALITLMRRRLADKRAGSLSQDFRSEQVSPDSYRQGVPNTQRDSTPITPTVQYQPEYNYTLADSIPLASVAGVFAQGGITQSSLGGYAAGGNPRLLKGPGDGMSDSIPATINAKQPARLADGEFVVPADVVSHLGNGSTDAGAKHLYKMMDKVRAARTGRKAQGKQIKPAKFMPA